MRLTGSTAAPGRGRAAPAGLGLLAVLTATPGVHLFERWMAPAPAVVVSHGLAVVILGLAVVQWRAGRRARALAADGADRTRHPRP
jgi:glucose uptake protein GlcU